MLERKTVRDEMASLGVVPIRADFTKPSDVISDWLKRFGKAGVPMYVVIPADSGKKMYTLPEILTTGIVVNALRDASAETVGGN